MHPLTPILSPILVIAAFSYLFYFRPKLDERSKNIAFDNSVLACIDGIFFADVRFRCIPKDVRSYASSRLSSFRRTPGPGYIEYTTSSGQRYSCHFGPGDHMLCALIFIAEYADQIGNDDLVAWSESQLHEAHIRSAHYLRLL